MAEQLGLKYGNWVYNTTDTSKDGNGLPTAIDKGTIYVAKTSDGHAKMYVDSPNGERLSIGGGEGSHFATCTTATATAEKVITCAGMSAPQNGTMITVKFNPVFDSSINNIKLKINGTSYDVHNGTYSGNSEFGLVTSLVTFVYNGSTSKFEIMNNPWDSTRGVHINVTENDDDGRHYLIGTSDDYWANTNSTGPQSGPSGLWLSPYNNAISTDTTGSLYVPGSITINSNIDPWNSEGMQLSIGSESIRWYGYSDYTGKYGDWTLYNNGSSLQLFENYDSSYQRIQINPYDLTINDPVHIQYGDLHVDYGITTGGNISSSSSIYALGNLYHQDGTRVPRIYSGTTVPSDSVGQNGDIYIMYS